MRHGSPSRAVSIDLDMTQYLDQLQRVSKHVPFLHCLVSIVRYSMLGTPATGTGVTNPVIGAARLIATKLCITLLVLPLYKLCTTYLLGTFLPSDSNGVHLWLCLSSMSDHTGVQTVLLHDLPPFCYCQAKHKQFRSFRSAYKARARTWQQAKASVPDWLLYLLQFACIV